MGNTPPSGAAVRAGWPIARPAVTFVPRPSLRARGGTDARSRIRGVSRDATGEHSRTGVTDRAGVPDVNYKHDGEV